MHHEGSQHRRFVVQQNFLGKQVSLADTHCKQYISLTRAGVVQPQENETVRVSFQSRYCIALLARRRPGLEPMLAAGFVAERCEPSKNG